MKENEKSIVRKAVPKIRLVVMGIPLSFITFRNLSGQKNKCK